MKNLWNKIKAFFSSNVAYDEDGKAYTTEELDALRGIHQGRVAEQSKFALELRKQRLNNPVFETYEAGHKSGADPITIDAKLLDSESIKKLIRGGGSYYTGRVKTYTWKYKKVQYFNCLAEMVYIDQGVFVHAWQGPNPNPGYHTASKLNKKIEGPAPKIKGANYEENT